jgi:MoxR-like ATPase
MNRSSSDHDVAAVERCHDCYQRIRQQLAKAIVGQDEVIEQVLVTMFAHGHALLEGVPGLAKTLLVSSLAQVLDLSFKRIQFTPDLMPSDVTGTEVIQEDPHTGERGYRFLPGPLFANFILADEINRTPPKTQAAMLEAMQERQVSVGGEIHLVPQPFIVLATQNPLEQEGTYPLPEAQLDRFLLHIRVDYPSGAEEWEIARRVTVRESVKIAACLSGAEILDMQQLVHQVPVSDQVLGYAWTLVRASRPGTPEATDFVNQWVSWGAGPRGLLTLVLCAKARALLHGRYHATVGDVRALAGAGLRHRIAPNYAAQANHISSQQIVDMLLEAISPEKSYERPPGTVGDELHRS